MHNIVGYLFLNAVLNDLKTGFVWAPNRSTTRIHATLHEYSSCLQVVWIREFVV